MDGRSYDKRPYTYSGTQKDSFRYSFSLSENPLRAIFQTFENVSQTIQANLSRLICLPNEPLSKKEQPLFSLPSAFVTTPLSSKTSSSFLQPKDVLNEVKSNGPVAKEDLGRATWTFLHTLAAQYPDMPTRQQKKDVKELVSILSRMYPCKDCADHFKEILRSNPVQTGSQAEFSQWLCHVHNVVNRSLGKPKFPCERVNARWGKLDCEQRMCDLQGSENAFGNQFP
ncbi:FAD-linked sulfhydryl oxidase ERV1 [Impatiens glandulifera]|uniref:FAD-linked sulfhydryl oxidase ERV1 n=1 Tax=Impatiens glandulifera TaxID=253017 RepID=UPI001FB08FA2|nr:FAD-linked sulfhydryl oxidase ERV1 [Impatiens glandulifera]XP_047315736.1 FAD-linked sulfhydryl oxidase ERV1 [Impatiens glandulifera]